MATAPSPRRAFAIVEEVRSDGVAYYGGGIDENGYVPLRRPHKSCDWETSDLERRLDVARGMARVLSDRQREVLRMRFGLGGSEPSTLRQIGDALGVSENRASRIELDALERLRDACSERSAEERISRDREQEQRARTRRDIRLREQMARRPMTAARLRYEVERRRFRSRILAID